MRGVDQVHPNGLFHHSHVSPFVFVIVISLVSRLFSFVVTPFVMKSQWDLAREDWLVIKASYGLLVEYE